MLGPHFYFDLIRLARHRRNLYIRCGYLLLMLGGWCAADFVQPDIPRQINDYAAVARNFTLAILGFQYAMVFLLGPVYFAGAIAEEKESGAIELLFTTPLKDHEILLGKFAARVVHLASITLLGLPFLAITSLWGGVDMELLLTHFALTLIFILLISSACLYCSAIAKTFVDSMMLSNLACLGFVAFFGMSLMSFLTTPPLIPTYLFVAVVVPASTGMCLAFLWGALVEIRRMRDPNRDANRDKRKEEPPVRPVRQVTRAPREIPDNSLLWKELEDCRMIREFDDMLRRIGSGIVISGLIMLGLFFLLSGVDVPGSKKQEMARRFFLVGYAIWIGLLLFLVIPRLNSLIARERENGTLRFLLLLPIERSELLTTKFIAPWIATRYTLAILLAAPVIAMVLGIFPISSCLVLFWLPWPTIIFLSGFAMMLTVTCRREVTANIILIVVLTGLGLMHALAGPGLGMLCDGLFTLIWSNSLHYVGDDGVHMDRTAAVIVFAIHQFLTLAVGLICMRMAYSRFDRRPRRR